VSTLWLRKLVLLPAGRGMMLSLCVGAVLAISLPGVDCGPADDTLRVVIAAPGATGIDTTQRTATDTALTAAWLRVATLPDTGRKRSRAVAYSEWYGRRVTIHRRLSWAMLPLFAASYYTGNRLAENGRADSPQWVRQLHPVAAGGSAVLFGANTVTGVWNLWDSRRDTNGRTRRIVHSALFIAASAGFTYAGSLGDEAGDDGDVRSRHRNIAIASMSLSTVSWLIMLLGN
jgi:hypothetical protein